MRHDFRPVFAKYIRNIISLHFLRNKPGSNDEQPACITRFGVLALQGHARRQRRRTIRAAKRQRVLQPFLEPRDGQGRRDRALQLRTGARLHRHAPSTPRPRSAPDGIGRHRLRLARHETRRRLSLRLGPAHRLRQHVALPSFRQIDLSASRDFDVAQLGGTNIRVAVINATDEAYEIRDGTDIGVGAPQYGPRAGVTSGSRRSSEPAARKVSFLAAPARSSRGRRASG